MNSINKFLDRVSVRSYLDKEIEPEKLDKLIAAANSSATSINGFYSSVILIKDQKIKDKIFSLIGSDSQKHVKECGALFLFLLDLERVNIAMKITNQKRTPNPNNDYTFAVVDATIQSTKLEDAALLMDLSTCFLGGVRSEPILNYLHKALNLPDSVMPLVGLSVGYAKISNEVKPKLNRVYVNTYDVKQVEKEINDYDITLSKHWAKQGLNFPDYTFGLAKAHSKKAEKGEKLETYLKNYIKNN